MDPLTQGFLGAALPQATMGRKIPALYVGILGFLAGMAADLDVFIRSSTDPIAFLTYHRHFTHSLAFIPVGGLICALAFHWIWPKRWGLSFRETFLICTLGYATHALLDACTSYGTMLFWPFSDMRVSFSIVAVIDPLFTLPLAAFVIAAARKKSPRLAWAGLAWGAFYLSAGTWQQVSAVRMAKALAAERGHAPVRVEAKPSFGNILVFKTIYEADSRYYVDGVRPTIGAKVFPGASLPTLDVARDFPWLKSDTQQARDIERFRHFSQGFVAQDPDHPNRVIDVRYSFVPNQIAALWSIELSPDAAPDAYAAYLTNRAEARADLGWLWRMVTER